MKNIYIFDACSLIALLTNENGADVVKDLLGKAKNDELKILMHKVNFLEVYYYIHKKYDEQTALKLLEDIKIVPIRIDAEITDSILIKAGRLKSLDLFKNPLNQPVIVYNTTNQCHSQSMPIMAMSPVWI
jgi:PIN domain nuclease of toxin-antitoxin system